MLELSGISSTYGEFKAVDEVSLSVPSASLVGLIGPNGAGKSTVFSIISGFTPLTAGSIRFDGQPIDRLPPHMRCRRGLGRTFQLPTEFRHLTVRENLAVGVPDQAGENLGSLLFQPQRVAADERAVQRRVDEIIDRFGMSAIAGILAGKLSGGQKKLLDLARAMLVKPKLMLLDEPFNGVSPPMIERLSGMIRASHAGGIGFFIIEHNLRALSRLISFLHVMDRGRLIASGMPNDVLASSAVVEAYLGNTL